MCWYKLVEVENVVVTLGSYVVCISVFSPDSLILLLLFAFAFVCVLHAFPNHYVLQGSWFQHRFLVQ